jgi:hypothetical protein
MAAGELPIVLCCRSEWVVDPYQLQGSEDITFESTLVVLTDAPLAFLDEWVGRSGGGNHEVRGRLGEHGVAPLLFRHRTVGAGRIEDVHLAKPLDSNENDQR